jgi:hypothetical protein
MITQDFDPKIDHAQQLAQAICACNARWEYLLNDPGINLRTLHDNWNDEIYRLCAGMLSQMSEEVNHYRRIANEAVARYSRPTASLYNEIRGASVDLYFDNKHETLFIADGDILGPCEVSDGVLYLEKYRANFPYGREILIQPQGDDQ